MQLLSKPFKSMLCCDFGRHKPKQSIVWVSVSALATAVFALLAGIIVLASGVAKPEGLGVMSSQHWIVLLASVTLVLVVLAVCGWWYTFVYPQQRLQEWLLALHAGDLSQRLDDSAQSVFQHINKDLNTLAHMLETQSLHAERQLREHTEYIVRKNRSLSVLYRIASGINTVQQVEDVLAGVVTTLMEVFALEGALIRLRTSDGHMKKTAAAGNIPLKENSLYLDDNSPFLVDDGKHRCVVAVQHQGDILGYCSLYFSERTLVQHDDELGDLLGSIADYLGVAIAKDRLIQQNKNLSIVKERTWIAHELHDSLAQTINSLRFKTRVLDQALHAGNDAVIWRELEKLEDAMELANKEVRGLIRHFRDHDPFTQDKSHGASIEQCINLFRRKHPDINVFFQKEWGDSNLPAHYYDEILRIVQEALINAHKHGGASHVRVILRDNGAGNYFVLVEENGCGIDNFPQAVIKPDHFGLRMMEECAKRIGGSLQIDTEEGEGVRVLLKFSHTPPPANPS